MEDNVTIICANRMLRALTPHQNMSTDQDLVSIISPAFNAGNTIDATIRSVIAQTYSNWEMLIADDCSKDDTIERAKSWTQDSRVSLLINKENMGPAHTRNRLLQKAKGRYIAFLDTDDEWLPTKLEEQLELMRLTGAGICGSGYTRRFTDKTIDLIPSPRIRYKDMLKSNQIPMLTAIIDLNQHPNLEFTIKGHEDYQLWLDLTRGGDECVCVQKILAIYNAGNVCSVSNNKLKAARWHWDILSREPIPWYKKLYFFSFYITRGLLKNI